MTYSPILMVHICAGIVGLLSGTAAVIFRKGSRQHRYAGRVFVVSMLTMAAGAVYLAMVNHQPNNLGGGLITFYLIGTGWLTAKRRDSQKGGLDWLLLIIPLAVGILTWVGGIRVLRSGATSLDGVPVGMNFFMGSVCLLAAAGDVRMLVGGGILGTKRVVRHLWRMCFGLFIASGSFFLGPTNRPLRLLSATGIAKYLPAASFSTGFYLVLALLPLFLLVFWAFRIRFKGVPAVH